MKPFNKTNKNRVVAIVPAAGRGKRLGPAKSKIFASINNRPLLFFVLHALSEHPLIREIILVCSRQTIDKARDLVGKNNFNKVTHIVLGGPTRKDSVANGLKCLELKKRKFVLIHDAARPFVNRSLISSVVKQAFKFNAAICAVPPKCTIKSAMSTREPLFIKQTLKRSILWEVHTPQVFRMDLLKEAFSRFRNLAVTDEAALLEKLGIKVKIVRSHYFNIKITTAEDLIFAKAIAKKFRWMS